MKFFDSHTGSASYSFPGVALGQNVRIFHPQLVNMYGCAVGDDSRIGTFVEVQKGAVIGARLAIKGGSTLVRKVFLIVTVALIVKVGIATF